MISQIWFCDKYEKSFCYIKNSWDFVILQKWTFDITKSFLWYHKIKLWYHKIVFIPKIMKIFPYSIKRVEMKERKTQLWKVVWGSSCQYSGKIASFSVLMEVFFNCIYTNYNCFQSLHTLDDYVHSFSIIINNSPPQMILRIQTMTWPDSSLVVLKW